MAEQRTTREGLSTSIRLGHQDISTSPGFDTSLCSSSVLTWNMMMGSDGFSSAVLDDWLIPVKAAVSTHCNTNEKGSFNRGPSSYIT